ncbi:MAG: DUF192 domain-containing protein, partial [Phycisphaerales bacterium]|nr:DUF192 domain-containing protein [Phycisphaerales bacterium]
MAARPRLTAAPLLVCLLVGLPMVTTMTGCPPAPETKPAIVGNLADVRINGTGYKLEIAALPDVRTKGLGGRTEIAETGGMIFVFPPSQVMVHEFVMRDCPIDIDIIYTDGVG